MIKMFKKFSLFIILISIPFLGCEKKDKTKNDQNSCKEIIKAVRKNDINFLKKTVKNRDIANCKDRSGRTPLIWGTIHNRVEVVSLLLNKGADPNIKDKSGKNSIIYGSFLLNNDLLELFKEYKGEFNVKDKDGLTPIDWVLKSSVSDKKRAVSTLKTVLKRSINFDKNITYNLAYLSKFKYEMIDILIKKDKNIDIAVYDIFFKAIKDNQLDIVKNLVKKGVKIDEKYKKNTPLLLSSLYGYVDMVKFFIEKGANIETKGVMGNTPLINSSIGGHLPIVEYLIKKGVNINIQDKKGYTPLMLIGKYNRWLTWFDIFYKKCKQIKLTNQGDYLYSIEGLCSVEWDRMKTIINPFYNHIVRQKSDGFYIKIPLIDYRIGRIDYKKGEKVIDFFKLRGKKIAELLINNGADCSLKSKEGRTALYYAQFFMRYKVASVIENCTKKDKKD